MTPSALLLTAHGSRDSFAADAALYRHAEVLAACTAFDRVLVAFHSKDPSIARVLSGLRSYDVTVVPFMTSEGHFTDVVLPRALSQDSSSLPRRVRVTPPVGTHRGLATLVARRVRHQMQRFHLDAADTSLAIAGHGTPRHRRSREATDDLAATLARAGLCREVTACFLDEEPGVRSIADRAIGTALLVVPFLMTNGRHALRDIPEAVGAPPSPLPNVVAFGRANDRFLVCDTPIGTDPGMVDILADLCHGHA
ncbi:MAG: CbiX/SirB N-terminal domain-containing protein, partial [Phycisphaerae bacterium]